MTKAKSQQDETPTLTAHAVAEYLNVHPDFFLTYPDVLAELQVHHQNRGVVSLTQLQSEQYRDKIKSQKKQLEKLITNARRNEDIYKTYAQLNLAIAKCADFAELEQTLHIHVKGSLGLQEVHLYPFASDKLKADKLLPEIQQRSIVDKKLGRADYYFGRLGKNEKQLLFNEQDVESVALIQIGEHKPIAILAISSTDPLHFTPDMDTTLLSYLRDFLSFQLPKLL